MTRYAILRLVNGHAEPMRGNIIELFEEKDHAYDAGRIAVGSLASGQRLAIVSIVGTWTAREGYDYTEATEPGPKAVKPASRVSGDLQDDVVAQSLPEYAG